MLRRSFFHASCALAALAAGAGTLAWAASASDAKLRQTLAARLPRTPLTAIDCGKINGLCEVQSGNNLFYTDGGGRFLVIGRIYDMATRQDLTAARLLDISPELLVGGAAKAVAAGGEEAAPSPVPPLRDADEPKRVTLTGLPDSGAIRWGSGSQTVTVFSDFRCGYCNQLHRTLAGLKLTVIERPISLLGTRAISEAVICADDRVAAAERAYNQEPIGATRKCDTSGLDANEAFARRNGFTGTPVMVRSDGVVVHGYRPRAFLETWLRGAR